MMSKKRLEEIERQLNRAEIKRENLDIYDFQNILEHQLINGNLKWLVKYAKEQSERVQELELEVNDWREEVQKWQKFYKESEESHLETKELLKSIIKQNKRYREYLELIRITSTHGRIISTGEIIRSDEANLAEEALEGEE